MLAADRPGHTGVAVGVAPVHLVAVVEIERNPERRLGVDRSWIRTTRQLPRSYIWREPGSGSPKPRRFPGTGEDIAGRAGILRLGRIECTMTKLSMLCLLVEGVTAVEPARPVAVIPSQITG